MDAMQQHMLDAYRAAQRGEAPPPPPGRDDLAALRVARDHLRRSGSGSRARDGSTGCGQ
ncbi:hypothetical protein [Streptomyces sp. CB03234]|uniref:hypothetical protein n=1 Tax=Streptomyces sp. (strain CB03234) TaxID=1703937 RepID=UPI0018EA1456|nr:hypothetical protein [Streptomyces sp. CB03234]